MSITISDKRANQEKTLNISDNFQVSAIGTVKMNIPFIVKNIDFFPSSFKVILNDRLIYIDPVCTQETKTADIVLITHHHEDHFSLVDIKRLMNEETVILCPTKVYKKLCKEIKTHQLLLVKPHESNRVKDLEIETIPAYNLKKGLIVPHSSKSENVGFVISSTGFSMYITGDSDLIPEMRSINDLSVLIAPIDGDNLTMSTMDVVELVNLTKPQYVIPSHYMLSTESLEVLKKEIKSSTVVILDGINL